ncbi:uncharacterized protein CDAR_179721 [Caerostris darwini]|uniref:Uncharacterized protein n=1 Tax=Caerostris darwini TaxID=1538125 RepID=A0AAV4QJY4_9ARAC|nr:uncharacterized protein CDAR_179721 [Caerostris darwini]
MLSRVKKQVTTDATAIDADSMFALVILSCISLTASNGIHQPQPYNFGYSIKDHHGEQHREESGNGAGAVVGNFGDDRGFARQVN